VTSERDPNPLITLLRDCVVRIDDAAGRLLGTGFFVAPGRVVTCAHVVLGVAPLFVRWPGHSPVPGEVAGASPPFESATGRKLYPLPDLALIDLGAEGAAWPHPCVRLAAGSPVLGGPDSVLYLTGYTDEYKKGVPVLTGVSTEFESEVRDGPDTLYKLKRGQVRRGYSGSPLLDLAAGVVTGVIEASRGTTTDLGGFAVPATELAAAFPEVAAVNREFHRGDPRWQAALEEQQVRAAERDGSRGRLGLKRTVVRAPAANDEIPPVFAAQSPVPAHRVHRPGTAAGRPGRLARAASDARRVRRAVVRGGKRRVRQDAPGYPGVPGGRATGLEHGAGAGERR
jgi:hypothetical protein